MSTTLSLSFLPLAAEGGTVGRRTHADPRFSITSTEAAVLITFILNGTIRVGSATHGLISDLDQAIDIYPLYFRIIGSDTDPILTSNEEGIVSFWSKKLDRMCFVIITPEEDFVFGGAVGGWFDVFTGGEGIVSFDEEEISTSNKRLTSFNFVSLSSSNRGSGSAFYFIISTSKNRSSLRS